MLEAYSHEVSSAGYWPGGEGQGLFYSYAYPEPDGYREAPVRPAEAFYSAELGEFVLPYEAVTAQRESGTVPARVPAKHLRGGGQLRIVGPCGAGAPRLSRRVGEAGIAQRAGLSGPRPGKEPS